jgi:hypothetical protein
VPALCSAIMTIIAILYRPISKTYRSAFAIAA